MLKVLKKGRNEGKITKNGYDQFWSYEKSIQLKCLITTWFYVFKI